MAAPAPAPKKTRGRQKIAMRRIQNDDERLITFSKRKHGIIKKLSELTTLTGAEVAFVVFSPAGKPFSFGHPSVKSIANRFLGRENGENDETHPLVEAHRKLKIDELNTQHNERLRELDEAKDRGKVLKSLVRPEEPKGWWDSRIEELNLDELLKLEASYKELRAALYDRIRERSNGASSSSQPPMLPPGAAQVDPTQMANAGLFGNQMGNPNPGPGYPGGYGNGQF